MDFRLFTHSDTVFLALLCSTVGPGTTLLLQLGLPLRGVWALFELFRTTKTMGRTGVNQSAQPDALRHQQFRNESALPALSRMHCCLVLIRASSLALMGIRLDYRDGPRAGRGLGSYASTHAHRHRWLRDPQRDRVFERDMRPM
jgi:hypothetical protein